MTPVKTSQERSSDARSSSNEDDQECSIALMLDQRKTSVERMPMDSSELTVWVELLSTCVVFVDPNRVNLDDLLNATRPGSIVRCDGSPKNAVLIHVLPQDQYLGCVGGMISEE